MICKAIQFMRPNGRRQEREFELPDEYEPAYRAMEAAGCRFEAEELLSGLVSITISNDVRDVDARICGNDWSKVEAAHTGMLGRGLFNDLRNLVDDHG